MPTDTEKLAIAEEKVRIAKELMDYKCNTHRDAFTALFDDVSISFHGAGGVTTYRAQRVRRTDWGRSGDGPFIAESPCPVECLYAARQKLAAEREAARTPEERRLAAENERLRKAMQSLARCEADLHCPDCRAIARKALEQGA